MKVCLFCEGCYPYVPGGVSGWVQMLISAFPDIEFSIVSIATSPEEMSEFAYSLPENVSSIDTLYLSQHKFSSQGKTIVLSKTERKALKSLFGQEDSVDWNNLVQLIERCHGSLSDLLMSEAFYEVVLEEYNSLHLDTPFFSFLWNCRSMYYPFLSVLNFQVPEADVYHSVSTGYAGMMAAIASWQKQKPYILTEHGIYTREREEDIIRSTWVESDFKEAWIRFFKKLSMIAYLQADRVISLFEVNRSLQIELGCPKEKTEVISNGVDFQAYQNLPAARLKPEPPAGGTVIGAILRIVPIKDVKTMLLAYATAKKKNPSLSLYLMGNTKEDPEYFQECMEMSQSLGLQDVHFLGQVHITEMLSAFDLLLLSSISEGQPLSILEGLAAGIPFICTNVGDCTRILCGNDAEDTEQAGLIVPVMDSAAMADAILTLADNDELRKAMGEAGKRRIQKYYEKSDFLARYHELYLQLGTSHKLNRSQKTIRSDSKDRSIKRGRSRSIFSKTARTIKNRLLNMKEKGESQWQVSDLN